MNSLDNYDSVSERLNDSSTIEERFNKFAKIVEKLKEQNIEMIDFDGSCVYLEDKSCGFKLGHNFITWNVFRVIDVADMIISARDKHIQNIANNEEEDNLLNLLNKSNEKI